MLRALRLSWQVCVVAMCAGIVGQPRALGQWTGDDGAYDRPVYQRHAFEKRGHHGDKRRHFQRGPHWVSPQVNAGWFQRPYPYHLDYYKMRYGGSYAPYFGNLYGPPQVVTAPPYYGPYYGGYEFANPGDAAYGVPGPVMPPGAAGEPPMENSLPAQNVP